MQNPRSPSSSRHAWIWPVLMAAIIFAASSRSHIAGPAVEGSDKGVHFVAYGLLATAIVRLGRGWRAALLAILLTSLYGVSDEWHQSFTPGRSVDIADWVADTIGAVVAVALYSLWPWYRALLEMPLQRKRRVENPAVVASVSGA